MTTPRSRKLKGVVVEKPFVFGSISFWQGKKVDDSKSFSWTVYVRGVDNEDLSYFVKRVTFHLHNSFEVPTRHLPAIDRPPSHGEMFEVNEEGWGEFTIGISIQFHDPTLKTVELQHVLKLFPEGGQANIQPKRPVISEHYEEFVFTDPTEEFHQMLMAGPRNYHTSHPLIQYWPKEKWQEEERKQLQSLARSHNLVLMQIAKAKAEMQEIEAETALYKEQISVLGKSVKR